MHFHPQKNLSIRNLAIIMRQTSERRKDYLLKVLGLPRTVPFLTPPIAMSTLNLEVEELNFIRFSTRLVRRYTALLGETPHTIAAKLSRTIVVVYNDLSKVAETSTSIKSSRLGRNMNIQNHHLDIIMTFVPQLKTTTISNSRGRLSDNNCSLGIANESSVPDGYFKDSEMNARGIFEVRHSTDAPAEGIRQGAASASNVALCQFQHGVNVEDIVVPIIGSNGYLMQFAAVIMLKPSFPILVMLSSVLDLTDNKMLLEAARLLCCVRILTSHPLNLRRNQVPISRLKIAYSTRECDFVLKIT